MRLFGYNVSINKAAQGRPNYRNYSGAKGSNLTADWMTTNLTADETIRWSLRQLRSRSRDLAINNDHMKNFLRKLKVNVVGPSGIGMQSKARLRSGELDARTNPKIEAAWADWTKRRNASVCGTQSLRDLCNTALETVARDGEVLLRKYRAYDNPFRFALQIIEADHLDENLNRTTEDGNRITMGIEKNPYGKPVAYYLFAKHPGDSSQAGQKYVRVPAEEIIHIFLKERPTQSRGVPWAHTAIIRLRMLGAYEEAALVNARIGASKMQSIIMGENQSEFEGDSRDAYNNIIQEVEPGMRDVLPYGTTIHDSMPPFPNGEHGIFTKAMLRGIASGLGVSYNSLANDLEGVNFSSLRSGLLEERDGWKAVQTWFIESMLDELYPDWLDMAIISGQLSISMADTSRLSAPRWQPRRWEWVDPEKDINARITALKAGLTTRTRICGEVGDDFEEILEELEEEQQMIDDAGLVFNLEGKTAGANQQAEPNKPAATNDATNSGGSNNGN